MSWQNHNPWSDSNGEEPWSESGPAEPSFPRLVYEEGNCEVILRRPGKASLLFQGKTVRKDFPSVCHAIAYIGQEFR